MVGQRLPPGHELVQGYTNIGDFSGTFAYGIKGRAEIFGSVLFDTRIDRDVRPLFVADPTYGGFVDRYPRVHTTWTGDNFGDVFLGAKVNFWSQATPKPAALAVKFMVKLPTANSDDGIGTEKPTSSSTSSQARNWRKPKCPVMPATSSAASPTTSIFPAARSGGASAPASRRGNRCASRPN